MTARTRRAVAGLLVAALAAAVGWSLAGHGSQPGDRAGSVDPESGLAWISLAQLPPEALTTLHAIDSGGPYLYPRNDDTVFTNSEGLLPGHQSGYYREYTVVTPGSPDRGARRIVRGDDGELYYTDDHYRSFRRIAR